SEVGMEPDWSTIQQAVSLMRQSKPDTIIALGGGSVLDAAKVMRLFYDYPELKLEEITVNFLDFRHRLVDFPPTHATQLVAIPTTSGTGSEVTPFAVLKDNEKKRKYSFVDEYLMPDVAIIDANLTKSLPKEITVDTAFDALTHALEALVSTFATDYTDGLALEAIRLIFEALPEVLKNGSNVLWRHKLHNAACLAGMAIGNASVGINHALAHSLGAKFDVPHGRANGVFLLTTLEHNSKIPQKFMPISGYALWVADKKYARAAQFLGLVDEASNEPFKNDTPETTEKAVLALRRAVYDLARAAGQPLSIAELGISPQQVETEIADLVRAAFEDMSGKTNPSVPLLAQLPDIFIRSYPPRQRP
ncbi:MAG TPA: iron-containing alcohol dehydrogenase, partial [Chroococcales cyanobacterium]